MSGAQLTAITFDHSFKNIESILKKNTGNSLFESGKKYPEIPNPHPITKDLDLPIGDYAINFSIESDALIIRLKKRSLEENAESVAAQNISLKYFSAYERAKKIRENTNPRYTKIFNQLPTVTENDKEILLEHLSNWITIDIDKHGSFFNRLHVLTSEGIAKYINEKEGNNRPSRNNKGSKSPNPKLN